MKLSGRKPNYEALQCHKGNIINTKPTATTTVAAYTNYTNPKYLFAVQIGLVGQCKSEEVKMSDMR